MGVRPSKVIAFFLLSNRALGHVGGQPEFCTFLNREFWFLANGWYDAGHSGVDKNIQRVLRNGLGYQLAEAVLGAPVYGKLPSFRNRASGP